jgi:hypothetical protein
MCNEEWSVELDGEKHPAVCSSYYDGPCDFYIEATDTYLRFINSRRTQWAVFKGKGNLSGLFWDELFSDREWEAYQNPVNKEGKIPYDIFVPMDKKDLEEVDDLW